ncbi:hypothetical protein [Halococcus salifodinae]|nr:hypothetical protein [Halococcus salifodinae]
MRTEVGGFCDMLLAVSSLSIVGVGLLSYATIGGPEYISSAEMVFYAVIGTLLLSTRFSERVQRHVRSVRQNRYIQTAMAIFLFAIAGFLFVIGGHLIVLLFGVAFAVAGIEAVYNMYRYGGSADNVPIPE